MTSKSLQIYFIKKKNNTADQLLLFFKYLVFSYLKNKEQLKKSKIMK